MSDYNPRRTPRRSSAADASADNSGTPEVIHEVEATFDPEYLASAIKRAHKYIEPANGFLFIAAIGNEDSDLFKQQACAPSTKNGRIVIGLQGQSYNHAFVDIPADDVKSSGFFLIDKAQQLQSWASVTNETATMHYRETPDGKALRLSYKSGHDEVDIKLYYTREAIDRDFQSHTHRFVTPAENGENETLAAVMNTAHKIADTTQSTSRSGDLTFARKDGPDTDWRVSFVTQQSFSGPTVVTSQRVDVPASFPLSDIRWEIAPRHLSLLKAVFSTESTINIEIQDVGEGKTINLFQAAFSESLGSSSESGVENQMYIQRQAVITADNQPLNQYVNIDLVRDPNSKLYATAPTSDFFSSLKKTWALRPTAIIESVTRPATKSKPAHLEMRTYGGRKRDASDKKVVRSVLGDSDISRYRFFNTANDVIERLSKNSDHLQLRSFVADGEEQSNGYVIVPLTSEEDESFSADTLEQLPENINRFIIVNWPQG